MNTNAEIIRLEALVKQLRADKRYLIDSIEDIRDYCYNCKSAYQTVSDIEEITEYTLTEIGVLK